MPTGAAVLPGIAEPAAAGALAGDDMLGVAAELVVGELPMTGVMLGAGAMAAGAAMVAGADMAGVAAAVAVQSPPVNDRQEQLAGRP